MVFLFILDVITSASLRIVVNCGTWIAYKSANGACYLYRKLMPQKQSPEILHERQKLGGALIIDMTGYTSSTTTQHLVPDDDAAYVLITREEYDRMKSGLIV